ncbi:PepSY-associated TM helix domain-containing protein [Chitiniphilus eburneus]|uniref:PepSY domain-containing protein n=1 Tax=Chitiniphilus eburneus TaxID=2571148 RepID=A0A4U0QCQ6_9NEIS|nr:PepSY-associated TM helix domain-containing protein [Chitiniphilus eburneus]TJZ78920.1 PepSY domain-containing protein [Chitiniphilus eburneus]
MKSDRSSSQAVGGAAYKRWYWLHKWSSLACTLFLFVLCLTGLPLVFHHEIDHALGNGIEAPAMAAGTPHAPLDRVAAAALAQRPGEAIQYMIWEADEPDLVQVVIGQRADTPPDDTQTVVLDARTAQVLGAPNFNETLIFFLLKLHTDLFLGLPGKLFLGFMGLLFVVAVVSGIAVYGPLMRKLDFGTVRRHKARRIKWLDLHNLLGIATMAWVLVVGGTGVIASLADLALQAWRYDQLAAMIAPYAGKPLPKNPASLDRSMASAVAAADGMVPSFIAFPGTRFSSPHHYAVFMRGEAPLTRHLLKPMLVDAETAGLTDRRELPWYMTALLVSKPLHFGDYGGMPLKIIWGLLDLITLVVLGSGLYLWWVRHRAARPATAARNVAVEVAP